MPRQSLSRAIAGNSIFCFIALFASAGVSAADLDHKVPPQPQPFVEQIPQEDTGEFTPARRGCRLVPHPQYDLWGQVPVFSPTWVCVSRGIYADTLPPPPPPRRRSWYDPHEIAHIFGVW